MYNFLEERGFCEWAVLPNGDDALSDFVWELGGTGEGGYNAILRGIDMKKSPEELLVLINKALDMYHQRGDLSCMLIQGGQYSLDRISGSAYVTEMYDRLIKQKINENRFNNILFEGVMESLLMEAKTPEQILAILCKKFPHGNVNEVQAIISKIMSIDPTKKFSYTQWLVSLFDNERDLAFDVNSTFNRIVDLFQFAKQNNDFQLQTFSSLEDAFDGMLEFGGKHEYEVFYENENWIVYTPFTYAAERYIVHHMYGGATWCTASSSGDYYFRRYTDGGEKLYIFANKRTNEIYQFSPQSGEFNDSHNKSIDYPSELLDEDIFDFFESRGLTLNRGTFPQENDLYWGGTYGFKCINDLYGTYLLCDSEGHELSHREWSNVVDLDEYEGCIVIKSIERENTEYYVVDTKNDSYNCIAYFDDRNGEPFFWGQGSIIGLGDHEFSHFSLTDNELYFQEDGYSEFETVSTKNGYFFIVQRENYYDYLIYNPYTSDWCNYVNGNGETVPVSFEYSPEYDENEGMFYGEDGDGNWFGYNPKTEEIEREDEEDEVDESINKIRTKFNTILESISKPICNEKLND